jgi:hypothetical protein
MKKTKKALKTICTMLILTLVAVACDKDFSTVKSDIEGSENFNTDSKKFPIVAFNKKLNPVQTTDLSSNALGVYDGNIYGLTTASVISQIVPTRFNPNFGLEPELESVILTIPYFATNEGSDVNDAESTLYSMGEKDSLFGNAPIKLSIYRNNYFLRDFNPENAEESQKYYSNANSTINFDSHLGELLYENDDFFPSDSEIVLTEENEEGEEEISQRLAPSLRVELLNPGGDFWENLLFFNDDAETSHPELSNANNFKEYFRGLYFKAEAIDGDGHLIMLNFGVASIVVNYSYKIDEESDERDDGFLSFSFNGVRLNTLENDPANTIITNADADANEVDGDENLYLKGGEGSMAIIDLFNGEVFDEELGVDVPAFDYFMSKKELWLINEANLVFYVDQAQVNGQEPDRIMVYDLNSNLPLIDYFIDGSTNNFDPVNSKINHSRILERDEDEHGVKYKIRLTEHINSIFVRDSTNTKLGLILSTNVNEIFQSSLLDSADETVTNIPSGSVMSPRGTILHGSNENVDEEKRAQLEIFYTEPEN